MATTQTALGLNKQDLADLNWHTALNSGFDEATTRLTLNGAGTPEGTVVGRWKGQRYFDTLHVAFWVFNGTVGTSAGWIREVAQGTIQMWSGAIGSIPSGWVLCNGVTHAGTGYTPPDLGSLFVVGYKAGTPPYDAIGATGGAASVTLGVGEMPSHNHGGATTGSGAHQHLINVWRAGDDAATGAVRSSQGVNPPADPYAETDAQGLHNHTIASQGGGAAHENRPPFMVLAYIAKL